MLCIYAGIWFLPTSSLIHCQEVDNCGPCVIVSSAFSIQSNVKRALTVSSAMHVRLSSTMMLWWERFQYALNEAPLL